MLGNTIIVVKRVDKQLGLFENIPPFIQVAFCSELLIRCHFKMSNISLQDTLISAAAASTGGWILVGKWTELATWSTTSWNALSTTPTATKDNLPPYFFYYFLLYVTYSSQVPVASVICWQRPALGYYHHRNKWPYPKRQSYWGSFQSWNKTLMMNDSVYDTITRRKKNESRNKCLWSQLESCWRILYCRPTRWVSL